MSVIKTKKQNWINIVVACTTLSILKQPVIAIILWDTPNYTEKFRGIYTVGWNYRRKPPNTVGKRPTVGIILRPRPKNPRKFNGIFVIILFKKNQVTVTEGDNKRRKKSPTESKEEKKLPVKGWNVLYFRFIFNANGQ